MFMPEIGGAFDAIGKSMADFAAGAAAGAFAVSESGGAALRSAITEMARWVDDNVGPLRSLAREPELGSSHGAETMKPFVAQVAADGQGFLPMLMKFRESLEKAEQGIIDAMNNYKTMDSGAAAALKPL
jgi:hypothetical protein